MPYRDYRSYQDYDELERRRRADELASAFTPASPDAWIEQQANRDPTWMRRQADMTFSVPEAEDAPDMNIGLDEAEFHPDMTFSLEETERPDMTFTLDETERQPSSVSAPITSASRTDEPTLEPTMSALLRDRSMGQPAGRFPELDNQWRDAEQAALGRSGYMGEESYGFGEGLRDFAPMAIGGALDVLLNKGRGLGALTAGGMQALSMERARRDADKKRAGEFALDARRQRQYDDQAGLRAGDQALGWANYDQRAETNRRLAEMQRYNIDPNHPQALAMLEHVKQQTGVDTSGLSTKQQGQAMPLAGRVQDLQLAPRKAADVTRAELDVKHELAPRSADDEAMRGTVVEEGTRGAKLRTAGAERDLKNPVLDDFGAPILPQGITDDGRFAQIAQRNPELAQRYSNTVQDLGKLEKLNVDLVKVRDAIDAIPLQGRTRNNPKFAKLAGLWDEFEGAYQAEVFKAQDRGAPQVYEDRRFQGQIGAPMTWEDSVGQPVAALKSAFTNQKAMLEGRLSAIRGRRAAFIESTFGPQQQRGGPPGYGPQDRPSNLGVTGPRGVRNTPPIPQAAAPQPGGDVPRAVRQRDGTFAIDGEIYTEDEVQRLMRKGLVQ